MKPPAAGSTPRRAASLRRRILLPLALTGLLGCTPPPLPSGGIDTVRAELEQIPSPVKSTYMAVKSLNAWQNPYLTIQDSMVTLHVMLADANHSDLGTGGLLRPANARRQDLNVRLSDLPGALEAIPHSAWPYGRVMALEEAHDAPRVAEPQLRRNMEAAFKTLGNVGIVAYEWQDGGPGLK